MVAAVLLAVAGQLLRSLVGDVSSFLLLSVITLAGYGMGNVVLPPLVKKYFPDHLAMVTSGYVTMLAVGTWMAPQFSVPLANATGDWRTSIAAWALLSTIVLVPWVIQLFKDRKHPRPDMPLVNGMIAAPPAKINPWRSPWLGAGDFSGRQLRPDVCVLHLAASLPLLAGFRRRNGGIGAGALCHPGPAREPAGAAMGSRLRHPMIPMVVFTSSGSPATWACISHRPGTWSGRTLPVLDGHLRHGPADGEPALADDLRIRGAVRVSQGIGYAGAGIVPLFFGMVEADRRLDRFLRDAGHLPAVMMTGAVMINGPRRSRTVPATRESPRPLERVG